MSEAEVKRVAQLLNDACDITDSDKAEVLEALEGILYSDEDMNRVYHALQELN